MSFKEEIFNEILELLPEFKGKEQELKDIIDKLLQSKPDAEMNAEFKEQLKQKVLFEAEKNTIRKPFYRKLYFIIPGGLTAAAVLLFGMMFLFNPKSADRASFSTDYSPEEYIDQDTEVYNELETVDDIVAVSDSRDEANTTTEYEPEGPPGVEEQTPPANRDVITGNEKELALGFVTDPLEGAELTDRLIAENTEVIVDGDQPSPRGDFNTEEYTRIYENDFLAAVNDPVSTFSIDVDTASYSNTRRFIMNGNLPPADAVRIEELINYFDYGYPDVEGEHPFDFNTAVSTCPWTDGNLLLYVGVQGERMAYENLPPNNLVFLLDVSGSMSDANKLPLLKQSLELLTNQLRPQDRVSIVVYAGAAGVVLPPTAGNDTETIIAAFDVLEAGGSTAGGQGIELAYALAEENFLESGNNRIIIATDGDFNIGPSSTSEMTRLIEAKRDKGIYLTVLGFGMGNYKDSRMEQLADQGNGNYAYIDNIMEAKKVLVQEISSTLFTIASDVKIQIEFNPYYVREYRLVGYENRVMANQDFDDDKKDAGELGAGHTVTAIYEIVPANREPEDSDGLRYQNSELSSAASESGEIMTIKFRYKDPGETVSTLIEEPVAYSVIDFRNLDDSFRFAAAVAQWGMLLRDSEYKGTSTYDAVLRTARSSIGYDPYGLKAEFIRLVDMSKYLD